MTSSFKKTVFGLSSITLLFILTLILFRTPAKYAAPSGRLLTAAAILISGYNVAIVLSWAAFRPSVALGITFLSAAVTILVDMRLGLTGYAMIIPSFFVTSFFGFTCRKHRDSAVSGCRLKLEKLGEEINILSNGAEEKKKGIASVEEKLRRYSVLKEVIDSFSTRLMSDEIKELVMDRTARTIGKPGRILLFLVDTEKQELMLSASRGTESRVSAKKGDMFDRWVLKNRKALMIEDVTTDFRFSTDDRDDIRNIFRSLVAAPLISGDKVIGILRMDNTRELSYSQDDLRLLGIIADLGAVALENSLLYARTQELAIKDSLTNLAVRRYFLERLQAEVKRAALNRSRMSLLMIDIDRFKEYNDKFGHAAGDIVLKHMARTVSSMISEGDIAARYGGEELVVMLCGRSKKEALLEAEYMRKAVKTSTLTLRRHAAQVTVSIGLATYPEDSTDPEGLIKIADKRLYKAKEKGRDRVCST